MPATAKPQLKLDRTHGPVRVIVCDIAGQIGAVEGEDKPLPAQLLVMKWGVNETAKGRVVVNDTTLRVMPAVMKASNLDRIALDFEHNTVPGHPSYKGEPAKIAAMGATLVEQGRGIVLSALEYTAEGTEHIRGKHYGDLSPVVVLNAADEVIAVTSVAACRAGATPGLGITLSTDLFIKPTNMLDYRKLICTAFPKAKLGDKDTVTREVCLAMLGLKEDATDETIEAAARELAGDAKPEEAKETKELTASVSALTKKLSDLEGRETKRERELILSAATLEGKVVPKELTEGEGALDNVKLKALVATLPVTVPLDRRVDPAAKPANTVALSIAEETVRQQLGISKETWDKHNK